MRSSLWLLVEKLVRSSEEVDGHSVGWMWVYMLELLRIDGRLDACVPQDQKST